MRNSQRQKHRKTFGRKRPKYEKIAALKILHRATLIKAQNITFLGEVTAETDRRKRLKRPETSETTTTKNIR